MMVMKTETGAHRDEWDVIPGAEECWTGGERGTEHYWLLGARNQGRERERCLKRIFRIFYLDVVCKTSFPNLKELHRLYQLHPIVGTLARV